MKVLLKVSPLLSFLSGLLLMGCAAQPQAPDRSCVQTPRIYPDYAGVTFPLNIAPPSFRIELEGEAYQTEIGCEGSPASLLIREDTPEVRIPMDNWKALLQEAAGRSLYFRIIVKQQGEWVRYADIRDSVAAHPIDPFLAYRLLYPGYELWNEMGIYQRDLTTYAQSAIADNRNFGKQCVNCHTFNRQSPDEMMLHIRGPQGGTLVVCNGQVEKVNPKPQAFKHGATYPAWHPSGKYLAFSTNEIQQFFHSAGRKAIEVSDLGADLMVYDVERHEAMTDSLVYGTDYMETFPTWAPDGKHLYFCRAKGYRQGMPLDSIRYDLYRIQFDEAAGRLHGLECVYKASAQQKSVSFPRISPDGRYLMFTRSDYGNFSIWHKESDLYLLDLQQGTVRPIEEINSDDVDSYHTWSSTGQWVVFSSKRLDGLWARPHFAAFDPATGRFGKAFVLPQEEADFYDHFTYTYNLPELLLRPVTVQQELLDAIGQTPHPTQMRP